MKRTPWFLLVLSVVVSIPAFAQEARGYKISSVSVSSGESAINSGLTATVQFENEKDRLLEVTAQADQAWVLWGPKFKIGSLEGFISASAGHFQGSPWVGPMATFSFKLGEVAGQKVSIGTLQWPCVFFGVEPKKWRTGFDGRPANEEGLWIGYLAGVNLNIGPVGLGYSKLNFLDEPWNTIPEVSFSQKIGENFSVRASVSRNMNAKEYMYFIGATWTPTK